MSHKSLRLRCRPAALGLVAALGSAMMCGCGLPPADGPDNTFGLDFSLPPDARTDGAIIFIVDGMNAAIFQEQLEAGKLPAIKKYFVDRGIYVPRAADGNSSLTMNNLSSIISGVFPSRMGLNAAKWFDRNHLVFRHYETLLHKNTLDGDHLTPLIYEMMPDRLSFSLFLQPHRGATRWYENRLSAGPAFFFGMFDTVDRLALCRFKDVMDIARKCKEFPGVVTVYQLGVNFSAYASGVVQSEGYRAALRRTDRNLGQVLGDVARAGLLDKVVIALTADHGHCDTPRHPEIEKFIEDKLGIRLASALVDDEKTTTFESRLRKYESYPAVTYGAGDRYWALWLRRPIRKDGKCVGFEPWIRRPTVADLRGYPNRDGKEVDLLGELAKQEPIDALAYRVGPETVGVVTRGGEAHFSRVTGGGTQHETISYRLVSGTDPLGWVGKVPQEALNGKPLTGREWLKATGGTEFPDLPTGVLTHFDAVLVGDIVAYSAPQWDFDGWRRAGHGGIRAIEVYAPMLIAGRGIPHQRIDLARTVDLVPTILEALGRPIPPGLDGIPLFDAGGSAATQPEISR